MYAKGWFKQAWTNMERVREGKTAKTAEALGQEIKAMREIFGAHGGERLVRVPGGFTFIVLLFPTEILFASKGRSKGVVQ